VTAVDTMIEDGVPRGGLDMKSTAVAGIMRAERTPQKMTYGREIGTVKDAAPITLHVGANASNVELLGRVRESRETICVIMIEGGKEIMGMKMTTVEILIVNLEARHQRIMTTVHQRIMTTVHQALTVVSMEADLILNPQVDTITLHLEAIT